MEKVEEEMDKHLKIMITVFVIIVIFTMIMILSYFDETEKIEIFNNPCYAKVESIQAIKSSKVGWGFYYTYEVNGKIYEGEAPAGDKAYRDSVFNSKLSVVYKCDEPVKNRLLISVPVVDSLKLDQLN